VTFIHDFDESIKPDLFSAIDILAYPSAHESFGLALLEAWAAGRPVIACADTAPGSIVTDQLDGLLVRYHDESDLARALQNMLASPERRIQMGMAGKQKVLADHSWDVVAQQFRSVYTQARKKHVAA
jgi:glycosyltransferase involved in cell wall biosynthesis